MFLFRSTALGILGGLSLACAAAVPRLSLDEKIGQLFIVRWQDPAYLASLKPGGIVLFSANVPTVDRAYAVTRRIRSMSQAWGATPFIAIDHEGGVVLRLRRGLTPFPDAAAVAATGDTYTAFLVGKYMGRELRSLGVTMNFAPVLDLGNARSFLQNRIWGDRGAFVGEMATSFIRGLSASRVLSVAKHFPGHGRSTQDSHFELPKLDVKEETLWSEDLEPFRQAVHEGIAGVMTAHVVIPSVDALPASISTRFVSDYLRRRIGFQGLVITDDLEMGGIGAFGRSEDVAVKALVAGTDMVLITGGRDEIDRVSRRIKRAVQSGELPEAALDEKIARIFATKARVGASGRLPASEVESDIDENPYWKSNLRRPEALQLADEISHRAVSWVTSDGPGTLRTLRSQERTVWTVFVPEGPTEKIWKLRRPNDHVIGVAKLLDAKALADLTAQLTARLAADGVVVAVTRPRTESGDDVFQVIRKAFSRRLMTGSSPSTAIWLHQGARPVDVRAVKPPPGPDVGLVSLHTSSVRGISAFLDLLNRPANPSTAEVRKLPPRMASSQTGSTYGSQLR